MLRLKYEADKEFSILLSLCGDMDDYLQKIDNLIDDEKLFQLIESDLSQRYPRDK
jgi:hypothetical protein